MYIPEYYSTVDEIAATVNAAAKYGGILTAHIRGEGDSLPTSVNEALDIARRADMPLEISHFKCCGVDNWKKGIYEAIDIIERARRYQDVTVDFYPYCGGATTLLSLIPPDFPKNSWGNADALKNALTAKYNGWDNYIQSLGFERIILNALSSEAFAGYNGKRVADICADTGADPYELLSNVLTGEDGGAGVIVLSMS
jgi:N-acyl-D-amino-acid deacylase